MRIDQFHGASGLPAPFLANIPKRGDFFLNRRFRPLVPPQNPSNPEVSSGRLPILLCMFQKKIYL
jgi:hypothetical protein